MASLSGRGHEHKASWRPQVFYQHLLQVSGQRLFFATCSLHGSTFPRHFVDTECIFCHFLTELAEVEPHFMVEKSLTIV